MCRKRGGEDDTACFKLHVTNSRKKRGGGGGREGRMWETINNIEFIFPYRAERQRTVQHFLFPLRAQEAQRLFFRFLRRLYGRPRKIFQMSRRRRDSTHRQGGFSLSGFGEGGAKKRVFLPSPHQLLRVHVTLPGIFFSLPYAEEGGK